MQTWHLPATKTGLLSQDGASAGLLNCFQFRTELCFVQILYCWAYVISKTSYRNALDGMLCKFCLMSSLQKLELSTAKGARVFIGARKIHFLGNGVSADSVHTANTLHV